MLQRSCSTAIRRTAVLHRKCLDSAFTPRPQNCGQDQLQSHTHLVKHQKISTPSPQTARLLTHAGFVEKSSDDAEAGKISPLTSVAGRATFLLILVNLMVFLCDNVAHLPGMKALYLNHAHPQWHQWITHQFCHGSFQHLSANLFPLLIFGGKVEETEGSFGIACVYLLCGTGAAIASFLLTPAFNHGHVTVSVGASGAVFGLFAVSVLARLTWRLQPLVEAAILGQFVVQQVGQEMKSQFAGGNMVGGMAVSHVAHLGGALAGVLLVLLLHQFSDKPAADQSLSKKIA